MEARVIVLEGSIGRIEVALGRIEAVVRKTELDVAELKGRFSQLPTTLAIFTYMGGLVIFAIAVGGVCVGLVNYLRH